MPLETVCRLCLAMDAPMHLVSESPLQDIYEKLTKRTFNTAGRPVVACYVCYSQLWKCHSLMIKAERADELLTQILHSHGGLDREIVANVDRNAYNLIETLSVSPTDCFEVATSECNMAKIVEVTVKDEPQPYPVVETELFVEIDVKQERPDSIETVENVEMQNVIEDIKCKKLLNSQLDERKPTPIQDDTMLEQNLRNQHLEQGESSGNYRQVSKCKSRVNAATSSDNDYTSIIDNKINKYICGDCGETFSNRQKLMEHRGFTEKPFECTQCSYKTNDKSSLKKHLKIHSEKTLQCIVCGKKFCDKSNLTAHTRIHTGEKPYECKVCQRRFTHRADFRKHLKHTVDKPFECDTCQFKFSTKNALVAHIRTHTGERPFKCTICPKGFKMKDALNKHIRSHTGEKPFECTICKRRYSLKRPLVKHILKNHPEEKPFDCRICKQSFRDKGTLNVHLKVHAHK